MVERDCMIEITYNVDKAALIDEVKLEDLLKKYKRERSRKKMEPIYGRVMVEMASLADPQLAYRAFGPEVAEEVKDFIGKKMQAVIFAVCTLGLGVDDRYEVLSEEELAVAAILDEIALSWIVIMTRQFHQKVRQQCKEIGLKVGPAYRPGVGNLPIEVQKIVFDHLSTDEIGVSLNEYMVMKPIRSTSLVIPIYLDETANEEE